MEDTIKGTEKIVLNIQHYVNNAEYIFEIISVTVLHSVSCLTQHSDDFSIIFSSAPTSVIMTGPVPCNAEAMPGGKNIIYDYTTSKTNGQQCFHLKST